MTRCISCTRCVRFITEVAGVPEMGQTGRGEDSEITSYLGRMLTSELQGNVIDLCPVGALTSKPYAFTARPWELTKTESIDVMDALGSNIRVDAKGREVMRILPRNNDGVNEEWLADRSRFVWDGLRRQRLDQPYVREGGRLRPATWGEAFEAVAQAVKGKKVAGLVGDLVSAEAAFALKELVEGLGGTVECRTDGAALPAGNRSGLCGDGGRSPTSTRRSAILLVGTNPRVEAPVLNARIRKAWLHGAMIARIGDGGGPELSGDRVRCAAGEAGGAQPGDGERGGAGGPQRRDRRGRGARGDGAGVLAQAMALCELTASRLLVLHTAASRVGAMDLGCVTEGGDRRGAEGGGGL